jgi:hypothetical protein
VTQLPSLSRLFLRFLRFLFFFALRSLWYLDLESRPRKILLEDANRPELLVPIRLELDIEHHKLRDTLVWNLNGQCPSYSGDNVPLQRPTSNTLPSG